VFIERFLTAYDRWRIFQVESLKLNLKNAPSNRLRREEPQI